MGNVERHTIRRPWTIAKVERQRTPKPCWSTDLRLAVGLQGHVVEWGPGVDVGGGAAGWWWVGWFWVATIGWWWRCTHLSLYSPYIYFVYRLKPTKNSAAKVASTLVARTHC